VSVWRTVAHAKPIEENEAMPSDAIPMHLEALLEHQEFVRALARSLVRDPAAADDVVQETWISALTSPPRALISARGWLARVTRNHALNARRQAARRVRREEIVARDERDDSGETLSDRLALQQRVAAAVLGLREPYRSVILLHYHAGLSAEEIAKKRGVPSGTVRSQITRGLDALRAELDSEFGDRGAWIALLLPLAKSGSGGAATLLQSTTAKIVASALIVAGAVVAVSVWRVSVNTRTIGEPALAALSPSSARSPSAPSAEPGPVSPRSDPTRVVIAQALPKGPTDDELASRSIMDLLAMAMQVQRELRVRLLVPSAETRAKFAVLETSKDSGLARILERNRVDCGKPGELLGIPGNGYCYSFALRSNDYQADPSVALADGEFQIARNGIILDLGQKNLLDLPTDGEIQPKDVVNLEPQSWKALWADYHVTHKDHAHAFEHELELLRGNHAAQAKVGDTYLVRTFQEGRFDLLAAFTPVDQDAFGYTLTWRILKRWPIHGPTRRLSLPQDTSWVPATPDWIASLSTDELLATLARLRTVGERRILAVPNDVMKAQAEPLADSEYACGRIVERDRWLPLISKYQGAYNWSFLARSNDYESQPDVGLEQGSLHVWSGFILDLGEMRIQDVGKSANETPPGLIDWQEDAWRFLWNAQATSRRADGHGKQFEMELIRRGDEFGMRNVVAEVGHTYVIRSLTRDHEIAAALTLLSKDDTGFTFVARVITRFDEANGKPR
jgi:RNA polymerase sigma factor (sigma-70 family)